MPAFGAHCLARVKSFLRANCGKEDVPLHRARVGFPCAWSVMIALLRPHLGGMGVFVTVIALIGAGQGCLCRMKECMTKP